MADTSTEYDVLIVGAGPAGITAAYKLAGAGLNVLVFERGEFPGSKNMFGGILYSTILNKLIPEFWKEAPVERHVVRRRYSFLSKDSEAAFDLKFDAFNNPPYNHSFTVLRARFDKWFAKKAEEAGAVGSDSHRPSEIGAAWLEMDDFSEAVSFVAALRTGTINGTLTGQLIHLWTRIDVLRNWISRKLPR